VIADTVTADELRGQAKRLLSSFKVPAVWLVLGSGDDVPRGPTGKVDVTRLRTMLSGAGR
jgi:acyl-CoA synthetase (AMP-forming)/AMP-acid ligase II